MPESNSFMKWVGGIFASVIAGLLIWWLTGPSSPFNVKPKRDIQLLKQNETKGIWGITWKSQKSDWQLRGFFFVERDSTGGSNSYKGGIMSDNYLDAAQTLAIHDSFLFTLVDKHIKFCFKTPCSASKQCYDLIYDDSTETISGNYEHNGTTCIGKDYGTLFLLKEREY